MNTFHDYCINLTQLKNWGVGTSSCKGLREALAKVTMHTKLTTTIANARLTVFIFTCIFSLFNFTNMKADDEERCYTWLDMQNCEEFTRSHLIFCGLPGLSPICEFEVDFCIFVLKDHFGNVIKRGIRIWEYEYSEECECFDSIEEIILEYILSRPDFIDLFEFTYGPNGQDSCYFHWEVITEPCYVEVFNDGYYHLQFCEQEPIACCRNLYTVCYEEINGVIHN